MCEKRLLLTMRMGKIETYMYYPFNAKCLLKRAYAGFLSSPQLMRKRELFSVKRG